MESLTKAQPAATNGKTPYFTLFWQHLGDAVLIKLPREFSILLGLLLIGGILVSTKTTRIDTIFGEDKLVENCTAFLFLLTFLLGLFFFLKKPKSSLKIALPLSAVSGLGLLGFLDEVSFGARIFEFNYPKIGEVWIDGAHDIVDLSLYLFKEHGVIFFAPVFVILAVIAIICWFKKQYLIDQFQRIFLHELRIWLPPLILFACFGFLLVIAISIDSWNQFSYWFDINISTPRSLKAFEEVLELAAALALLFCLQALKRSNNELSLL